MKDTVLDARFRWQLFRMGLMDDLKEFTIVWIMPDGREVRSSSRHPDAQELYDFARRSMSEKIGCAQSANGFIIEDQEGNTVRVK